MILPLLLAAAPMGGVIAFQDTGGLDRAVAAFTSRPIGAEGGARTAIDARLRLAQCPTVALAWRTEAHDAVVVSCSGPDWRIFVPVIRPAAAPPTAAAVRPTVIAPAKAEPVIRRGDPVVIEAGSPGFSISREGVAIGDAPPGGRFMVKVDNTKAPVQAIAVEAGRATLPGWTE
ncbi:flagella basal body P-ring formation protein FlgA [Sphingomonas sp. RP10(2022)]|uniref:Flagella basal body P-ring formation protein FlgA n=1 Tax=Sphingomonas liriopis TaxID=2949094 RepID=A0A9X2HS54_9SPHN|nr:flagella basal body P-ring formation protein FlgA [Sphingomonas liriopis]MCP3736193.1 flagella basal body P-ring formation protein FlgA [Sphingomonas liriopis]